MATVGFEENPAVCVGCSQFDDDGVPASNVEDPAGFFSDAELCADGVTLLTHNQNYTARTYFIDPTMLENTVACQLPHYVEYKVGTPIHASAAYPLFAYWDTESTNQLISAVDMPIRLTNVLDGSTVATYPLIHPTTEEYISPLALKWHTEGSHFFTGSRNRICRFDARRHGSGPIETRSTAAGRQRNGVGFKGIVSTLAISNSQSLAAGTYNRDVALYDYRHNEGLVGHWNLAEYDQARDSTALSKGTGITQLEWSASGRYLYVAERKSDCIAVYDTHMFSSRVCSLGPRHAVTTQRMQIAAAVSADGIQEVFAGGTDGNVRVWRDPHVSVDLKEPDYIWKAHQDAVPVVIRPSDSNLVITCSGQRHLLGWDLDQDSTDEESEQQDKDSAGKASADGDSSMSDGSGETPSKPDSEPEDFSLKIWTFGAAPGEDQEVQHDEFQDEVFPYELFQDELVHDEEVQDEEVQVEKVKDEQVKDEEVKVKVEGNN